MRRAARRNPGLIAGTAFVALVLASCGGGQLEPVTEEGNGLHTLYMIMFVIAVVIFIGVELAIWGFPVVFRRRRGDDSVPEQIHGNNVLEAVWVAIPAVIVVALFVLSYQQITRVQAKESVPDREIRVTGKQWSWSFDYGDGVQTVGENTTKDTAGFSNVPKPARLVVPMNETIEFKLVSNDVIHSFYIPKTLYKLDVVPGQQNSFQVRFDETSAAEPARGPYSAGVFPGACAELCGVQHAQMLFEVEVVTPEQFDSWLAEQKSQANA